MTKKAMKVRPGSDTPAVKTDDGAYVIPHPHKPGIFLRAGFRSKNGRFCYYEPHGLNGATHWCFYRYAEPQEIVLLHESGGALSSGEGTSEGYLLVLL